MLFDLIATQQLSGLVYPSFGGYAQTTLHHIVGLAFKNWALYCGAFQISMNCVSCRVLTKSLNMDAMMKASLM